MAPSITGSARIVAASETAARRSRRLVRTVDLQPDEMVEQVDRGGEGEAEEVVEVESGIEEDGGAIIEPGMFWFPTAQPPHNHGSLPCHSANTSLISTSKPTTPDVV